MDSPLRGRTSLAASLGPHNIQESRSRSYEICVGWATLCFLCGGDSSDQIFLFLLVFGANRKGIQKSEGEGIFDAFVLTLAESALAENLHSYYCLAG
jgi:hypothetical protein